MQAYHGKNEYSMAIVYEIVCVCLSFGHKIVYKMVFTFDACAWCKWCLVVTSPTTTNEQTNKQQASKQATKQTNKKAEFFPFYIQALTYLFSHIFRKNFLSGYRKKESAVHKCQVPFVCEFECVRVCVCYLLTISVRNGSFLLF